MKYSSRTLFLSASCALLLLAPRMFAQEPPAKAEKTAPATADAATPPAAEPPRPADAPTAAPAPAAEKAEDKSGLRSIGDPIEAKSSEPARRPRVSGTSGGELPMGDHTVAKGNRLRDAISVLGSTTVLGDVDSDAVSVLGDTTIGPDATVGGAAVAVLGRLESRGTIKDEAVGVLGGVYIDGKVGGEAVAVLGNMELGPKAEIGGDVVVVGGTLTKHPSAVIRGNEVKVPILGPIGNLDWLTTWFKRCLLFGRPLAFGSNLGWAWMIAISFLVFYVLLALLFPRGIVKCAETLETRPGSSIVASILTVLLSPVAIVLLAVTVIGALLVPFVGAGLVVAKLFGKAVMLAWIGRRLMRSPEGALGHPAFSVLIGGVLVMLLYTVYGSFVLYKLLSWIGLGVVVYTVLLSIRREKAAPAGPGQPPPPAPGVVIPPPPAPSGEPGRSPAPGMAMSAETTAGSTFVTETSSVAPAGAALPVTSSGFVGGELPRPPVVGSATPADSRPPVVPMAPAEPRKMPAAPASTLPRAGFFIRLGALLLDAVLIGLLTGFLNEMLPRVLRFNEGPGGFLIMLAAYAAIMWKLRGTTIGGIVCGLKVVRVDNRELDWPTAVVRALGCFLSFVVVGLGFIWVAIDDERQSWHDKIAGTTVVHVPKGVSLL